jgi:hypothetical protein
MPEIRPAGASKKINMLIHSDIGVGKTSLIGSGGKKYRVLMIRPPTEHADPILGSGVQEMVVRDWEECFDGLEYLRHEGSKWDWVFLDNISLFQDIGLDDVYEGMLDRHGPHGSQARQKREQYGPDRGEYRVNMWRVGQWIRHAVGAAEFNLGIMAHSFWWEPKGEDAQNSLLQPSLYPWIQGIGMPSKICGMMNIVGYMEVKTREINGRKRSVRVLHTNKSENYYAKCQFKRPDGQTVFHPGDVVNPTLPKLMEMIAVGRPQDASRRRSARSSGNGTRPVSPNRRRATRPLGHS